MRFRHLGSTFGTAKLKSIPATIFSGRPWSSNWLAFNHEDIPQWWIVSPKQSVDLGTKVSSVVKSKWVMSLKGASIFEHLFLFSSTLAKTTSRNYSSSICCLINKSLNLRTDLIKRFRTKKDDPSIRSRSVIESRALRINGVIPRSFSTRTPRSKILPRSGRGQPNPWESYSL